MRPNFALSCVVQFGVCLGEKKTRVVSPTFFTPKHGARHDEQVSVDQKGAFFEEFLVIRSSRPRHPPWNETGESVFRVAGRVSSCPLGTTANLSRVTPAESAGWWHI